jgi:HEAT repeat protein
VTGPSPDTVLVVVSVVLVTTVAALSTAATARVRGALGSRRSVSVRARWAPAIDAVVAGLEVPSPILGWRERRDVLRLWCHYHESLAGAASQTLNRLAWRVGLDDTARQLLRSRRLTDRMLAVTAVGHLRDSAAWPDLVTMATPGTPLWEPAARALVRIDAETAVRTLAPVMGGSGLHVSRGAAALAAAAPDVVAAALGEILLEADSGEPQVRLLKLLASTRSTAALGSVRQLLATTADAEVIASSLRVLAAIRDPRDAVIVRPFADHSTWFVRLHAAEALGRMGCREDEAILFRLLEDREWLVRRAAADALAAARFSPAEWLETLVDVHPDDGARVALAHALAERAATC